MAVRHQVRVRKAPAKRGVSQVRHAARKCLLGLEHHHRCAGHAFDSAGDEQVALIAPDGLRGAVQGLKPRAAQAVDRLARHVDREVGKQQGHAGDVAIVLAGLVGATENHVVHVGRIDSCALDEDSQHMRGQTVRPKHSQRATIAAHRRTHVADDHCFTLMHGLDTPH